ncbi:alpha-galactosidase [Tessaracoccus antarcticus]|uniref:Alpha-galactosidase n=1 Tax=Tessaracoccus antarcticus TaxID=2479848 RepID=A0A3M0GJJ0_9ACTN|nr:alpha-galactosidase [Tessaracoccus antarcticus]RMB61793.1 alpha-galactosidase [Tessaracoccus antarcticus]
MNTQWELQTRRTAYVVSVLPDGSGLVPDHWGPQMGDVPRWAEPYRFSGFTTAADVTPLEYASDGQRHAAFSELLVARPDSYTGACWTVLPEEATLTRTSVGERLIVPLLDETGELTLELRFQTSLTHDVVRRSITMTNRGGEAVELSRAFSGAWNLPLGQKVRVDYLAGSWAREFQRRSIDLGWGTFSIGSRQGLTGLQSSPVVTLTALPDMDSNAVPEGVAYGVALDWSGSWRLQVECSPVGQHVRVSTGVHEDVCTVVLEAGQTFTSPDTLGVFSAQGPEGVMQAWHEFQGAELARGSAENRRPVVYNSWMATFFDVTVEHQKQLARIAADIGVETFVVDDGWFVGRASDDAGLGDWAPDPAKFPAGLAELAEYVAGLGMSFGIWIEPEGVNPDSDLYRCHPDWVYRAGERPLELIRHQYVLDLGRSDVHDWVADTLRSLVSSTGITYLKWDMNRPVSDGGRPGDRHGREWSLQHTRNYYRLLDMLRLEFPHVVVEACSSGGGRIDNAVLARADVVWASDEVGARDRLVIQDGFLSAYPASAMSSWVTDDVGHRDRLTPSLGYRFAVAMCGVLGIGTDLLAWCQSERDTAQRMISTYKDVRAVLHRGQLRKHGDVRLNGYCLEYNGPVDDPRTVLIVFDRDRDRTRDREIVRVHPSGLLPGTRYSIGGSGTTITAEAARHLGIPVAFSWAPDADVLVLAPVDAMA